MINIPKNPEHEKLLTLCLQKKDEFRRILKELRQKSIDTSLVDIKFISLAPKIKIAQITDNLRDVVKVQELVKSIEADIMELQQEEKAQSAAQDSLQAADPVELFTSLMAEIEKEIAQSRRDNAMAKYRELIAVYKTLPEDAKKSYYQRSIDLYKSIGSIEAG